ncbi:MULTISPECIES: heavy-metal-associated domain-containing protein [Enterococcus]|uniref:heavy-metal-associated domain-containing protein n=1 Tax=Enterococcus TaxID=1350 RepID=UPI00065DE8F9|nr:MULTISPECIES: heavy-metal-associated domain-containing protein [Enterococcus]KAF1302962.1 hypothetical protein BAU16_05665 [Enterococcus sp. JM9B]
MEKVIIQLDALTCPSCMQKIESAVGHQAGVEKVKVLFNAGKVKAEIDSSQISADTVVKVIEDLGYEVKGTKVKELV